LSWLRSIEGDNQWIWVRPHVLLDSKGTPENNLQPGGVGFSWGWTLATAAQGPVGAALVFEGRCWKFGDNIPTDLITPTHIMFKTAREMAAFVLEGLNPEFPRKVRPGDILVAGRNFGCSSGRALAAKALQATGIGAVVSELFARTFYRNGHEIGLPLLEAAGVQELVHDGDTLRVDIREGSVTNLTSGKSLQGRVPSRFLLQMLEAGGLIPMLRSGAFFAGNTR
jgi:3-isopropylmalate/(R)-2-methylmalate dehydratase small subunit